MRFLTLILIASVFNASTAATPENDAPPIPDKGVYVKDTEITGLYKSMAPFTQKALQSYPAAKKRFEQGLPDGQYFFVVTRLRDHSGVEEQVFVSVSEIKDQTVHGYLYNKPKNVRGYRFLQAYQFPEKKLIDWMITKPNGEQEGNFVGKFLEGLN